jgi:hypothetical protein
MNYLYFQSVQKINYMVKTGDLIGLKRGIYAFNSLWEEIISVKL